MAGNTFGKIFTITSFGESHGPAMGVVIDGVPPGLGFSEKDLQTELERRSPGKVPWTTSRVEEDKPQILSGIFEGKTLGTPIAVTIENKNQKSEDYDKLKDEYRPGHADKTTELKYRIRDHRGGGRASGRETVARVIGGYFAGLILPQTKVQAFISQLGPFKTPLENISPNFQLPYPDESKHQEIIDFLLKCKKEGNSVGGKIIIKISTPPVGLGEPVFDKLKADFAKAIMSIGACTSFGYGKAEEFANLTGLEATSDKSSFGGIEGGISNGDDIYLNVTVRAPSTVGQKAIEGRHDPCLLPRIVPVVESMIKIVLADHFLRQNCYRSFLE